MEGQESCAVGRETLNSMLQIGEISIFIRYFANIDYI